MTLELCYDRREWHSCPGYACQEILGQGTQSGVGHGILQSSKTGRSATKWSSAQCRHSLLVVCCCLNYPHICLPGGQAATAGLGYRNIMASQTRLYVGGLDGMV